MPNFLLVVFAMTCLWLIVTPLVHTGVCVTAGLGLLACSALAMLDGAALGERVVRLQTYGGVLVFWGLTWRFVIRPRWLSLSMRWGKAHALARLWGFERREQRRSE